MVWPHLFAPLPIPARAKLVFRFGDMIHEMVRREFRRVMPGEWGFEEARFHFRVPLSTKEADATAKKGADNFLPVVTMREWDGKAGGLILDEAKPELWVPLHVDGIVDLSPFDAGLGLAAVEIKSMATGSFLRALQGDVGYEYRVQMAAACEATGLDTQVLVSVRKDTCHLLEIIYSKLTDAVTIRFTKSSRMVELLRASLDGIEDNADWEAAEIRHPFEPGLLEHARARVRAVVLARPDLLPEREYGPSFVCDRCDGTGTQTLVKGGTRELKKPKPCDDCGATGTRDRAKLPWQCSYCRHNTDCWPMATLEITDRPSYWVKRSDWDAAGLTFTKPED